MSLCEVLSSLKIDFRMLLVISISKCYSDYIETQLSKIWNCTVIYEPLFLKSHSYSGDGWLGNSKCLGELPVTPPTILHKLRNQLQLDIFQEESRIYIIGGISIKD